jgi:hypothetical protein
LQHVDQHTQGLRAAVAWLAHDAQNAILSQRTAGPSERNVVFQPKRGTLVVDVVAVMQGNQHIDVEQRTHQSNTFGIAQAVNQLIS